MPESHNKPPLHRRLRGAPWIWAVVLAAMVGASLLYLRPPPADVPAASKPPVSQPVPTSSQSHFAEADPSLRWVLQGSHLLVNSRWLLNPQEGHFIELPYVTAKILDVGGPQPLGLSLSASGESIVVWDEGEFQFGPVRGPLQGPYPIPPLGPEAPSDRKYVLFWASENQLVVYQFTLTIPQETWCHLFKTNGLRWQPLSHCPSGDFLHVTNIDAGAGGWLAITSASEGIMGLMLARYDTERGQYDAPELRLHYFPGKMQALISPDGTRVDVATSCYMEGTHVDCNLQLEEDPWRLYSWRSSEEKVVLVRDELPPYFIPFPQGEQVAWLTADSVCVGRDASKEHSKCFCLPKRDCSAHP